MHQQPNNTRATFGSGSKQSPRDLAFSSKARCGIFLKKKKKSSSAVSAAKKVLVLWHRCVFFFSSRLFLLSSQGETVRREAASAEGGTEAAARRTPETHRNPEQDPGSAVGLSWPSGISCIHSDLLVFAVLGLYKKKNQYVYSWREKIVWGDLFPHCQLKTA